MILLFLRRLPVTWSLSALVEGSKACLDLTAQLERQRTNYGSIMMMFILGSPSSKSISVSDTDAWGDDGGSSGGRCLVYTREAVNDFLSYSPLESLKQERLYVSCADSVIGC